MYILDTDHLSVVERGGLQAQTLFMRFLKYSLTSV